jgi:hypothetical protein
MDIAKSVSFIVKIYINDMTISQAEQMIKDAGGDVDVFWEWMRGQTLGLNEDGTTDVYDYDVNRFIGYKCNPKNESSFGMD